MTPSVFFSIVIPTLNEEKYLPLLLKDLAHQTFLDFEVIVVDGGSQDKTLSKSESYKTKISLEWIVSPKPSVSHQRNLGAKIAQAKWLIFMDADNRIPAFFLQGVKYQLEKHPQTDLFSCWVDGEAYSLSDRPMMELANITMDLYAKVKPVVAGALIGVKKSVFKKVQFDETLTLSEDHDFVLKAIEQNYRFRFFREPRYVFSLRRFKKEGTLKIARIYAKAQLYHLMGKKMTEPQPDYPMGGEQYQHIENTGFFKQVLHSVTHISQKQLHQARELVKQLSLPNF